MLQYLRRIPEHVFLSTLSLRRATWTSIAAFCFFFISIHALLAESDDQHQINQGQNQEFLSTLSLRRATRLMGSIIYFLLFLSTLSLRRATTTTILICTAWKFLSTLSLRRATRKARPKLAKLIDFYPRSPCGERPWKKYPVILGNVISIHALLAESDTLCYNQGFDL